MFAVLAASLLLAPPAAAETRKLRFGVFVPAQTINVRKVLEPWVEDVNRAAAGEVEIELFSGGTMGRSGRAQYDLLRARVHDIGWIILAYTPGQFPGAQMFELPIFSGDAYKNSLAFWEMYQRGLLPGFEEVVPLTMYVSTPFFLHLNFRFRTLDDFRGRKIRAVTYSQARVIEALGGTPVGGISATQVAESLSRGLIEGAVFNWFAIRAVGISYVTTHHLDQPIAFSPSMMAVNRTTWDSLSPRMRDIFREFGGEHLIRRWYTAMDEAARANIRAIRGDSKHVFVTTGERDQARWNQAIEAEAERIRGEGPGAAGRMAALGRIIAELDVSAPGAAPAEGARP